MNVKAFLQLTRLHYGFIIVFAVLTGIIVTANSLDVGISIQTTVFACLSAIFIQIGAFVIGDFFDIKTDRANKRRDRPLATGAAKKSEAVLIFYLAFFMGLVFSLLINELCFLIAVAFTIISVEYAYVLKKVTLIGNMAIAACAVIPFFYGNFTVLDQVPSSITVLALIVFIAIIGREIIIGIKDIEGDKKYGRRTLPVKIGARKSAFIAASLVLTAIALSFIPFFYLPLFQHDMYYLVSILLCDFLWFWAIVNVLKLQNLTKVRTATFVGQLFGVLAFLLGALL